MIVQHNITSMNANRQLGIVGNNLAKSTEKLSSGYRINRAADDAAGLAISEKMRAQVRGLNRASDNAQDGISLIQTAEGDMDQPHSILQRTRELLVQASNSGVLDGTAENDFQKIQDEIDTLKSEYERINTDTEFNRKKLLDGSYKDQYLQLGANNAQGINVTIKTTAWDPKLYLSKTESTTETVKDGIASTKGTTDGTVIENGNGKKISQDEVDSLSTNYDTAPTDKDKATLAKYGYSQDATGAGNLKTDINDADNKSTAVPDVDGEAISGLLDNVDTMIKSVTTERSKLGAVQNRLEYTVKVDDNTSENLQSAESRIRDTDMADEMTRFSNHDHQLSWWFPLRL